MAHRIVIDEAKLRDEFEEMLDEIYWQYFYHPPTKMTTPGQVETDRDRQSEYYMYQGQGG